MSVSRTRTLWLVAGVHAAALAYATARYNVFKGVAWSEWPSYTLNKSLALAALALVVVAVFRTGRPGAGPVRPVMAAAGGFALAHVLLSLALLGPAYYAKFFDGQKLTAVAGAAIALGAASAVLFHVGRQEASGWSPVRRYDALAAVAFIAGTHAALPGFSGWFEPSTWPGGLPPITLVSFALGVAALGLRLRYRIPRPAPAAPAASSPIPVQEQ